MTKDLIDALRANGFEVERIDRATVQDGPIWTCKIGLKKGANVAMAGGCDFPMRCAVEDAFQRVTGQPSDFLFSGWGGELDDGEQFVVGKAK